MTARGVFDLVKRHVKLPVNTSYDALKQVLRDWVQYSEHTTLTTKPTFYAELHIDVIRPAPPPVTHSSAGVRSVFERWSNTTRTHNIHNSVQQQGSSSTAVALHRYRHVVPLQLWTAVLPWEVQRGLSYTALPQYHDKGEGEKNKARSTEGSEEAKAEEQTRTVANAHDSEGDEDDPYGIVSAPAPADNTNSVTSNAALPPRHRPGMLFLLDTASVRQNGVNFWCGAILQPIDVLFLAATVPTAVAQSASFAGLRQRATEISIADNNVSPEIVQRYFRHNEMRSALTEWRVLSHDYLDPSPSLVPQEENVNDNNSTTAERRLTVRGPSPSASDDPSDSGVLPQYVLETVRHVLRDEVQAALRRSAQDWQQQYNNNTTESYATLSDTQAELELKLELSDALKEDLIAKAQLAAHYVPALQDNLTRHLRQRQFDARMAEQQSGAMADPNNNNNDDEEDIHNEEENDTTNNSGMNERPMRVWLSETESVWMTPRQMAARRMAARKAAQAKGTTDSTETEESGRDAWAEEEAQDDAEYMQQADTMDVEEVDNSEENDKAVMSVDNNTSSPTDNVPTFVQPAEPHGVQASRSLSHQSPILRSEDEGRPHYLSPSFIGRHESTTLQPHSLVVSANKLARYPATQPQMPAEAPVDYELLTLCARLGFAMDTVMHYYYDRIMRDWTQELRRLTQGDSATCATPLHIDTLAVQQMYDLVNDAALQLPEELCSLVNAVAARRLTAYTLLVMTFAPPKLHFKGGAWTNAEDQVLQAALAQYGLRDWERVASMLTKKTAAQCRDRWENYLDPRLSLQEQWTAEEEDKLVELQGLFPNQWRLISTQLAKSSREHRIRPAWLCEEHYQELRDQFDYNRQQQSTTNSSSGETKMTMEEFMAARRRRRAPYRANEEKAARADTIDGERFEKEMIEMAVSRLANQDQKKGMRKERQRQLEEASFLAKLENNREGVESGTLSARQAKRMRRALEEDRHGAPKVLDQVNEEAEDEEEEEHMHVPRKRLEKDKSAAASTDNAGGFTALDINEEEERAGTARRQRVLLRDLSAQQRAIAEGAGGKYSTNTAVASGGVNLALLDSVAAVTAEDQSNLLTNSSNVLAIEQSGKAKALTWDQVAAPRESVEDIFATLPPVAESESAEKEQIISQPVEHIVIEEKETSVPQKLDMSEPLQTSSSSVSSIQQQEEGEESEEEQVESDDRHAVPRSPALDKAKTQYTPVQTSESALMHAHRLVAAELARQQESHTTPVVTISEPQSAMPTEVALAEARACVERFIAQGGIADLTESNDTSQLTSPLPTSSSTVVSESALHALERDVGSAIDELNTELRGWSHKLEKFVAICFTDPNDIYTNAYVQDGQLPMSPSHTDTVNNEDSEAGPQYVSMDYLWSYWHGKLARCEAEVKFLTRLRVEEQAAMREELNALRDRLSTLQSRERILQNQYREKRLAGEL